MAFATYSGPVLSGTVRKGPGKNLGSFTLVQTDTPITLSSLGTNGSVYVPFVLPDGARVIDIFLDVLTTTAGATLAWSASTLPGAGDSMCSGVFIAGATGRAAYGLTTAALINTRNALASPKNIFVTYQAAGTFSAGVARTTIVYVMRTPDGLYAPVLD